MSRVSDKDIKHLAHSSKLFSMWAIPIAGVLDTVTVPGILLYYELQPVQTTYQKSYLLPILNRAIRFRADVMIIIISKRGLCKTLSCIRRALRASQTDFVLSTPRKQDCPPDLPWGHKLPEGDWWRCSHLQNKVVASETFRINRLNDKVLDTLKLK